MGEVILVRGVACDLTQPPPEFFQWVCPRVHWKIHRRGIHWRARFTARSRIHDLHQSPSAHCVGTNGVSCRMAFLPPNRIPVHTEMASASNSKIIVASTPVTIASRRLLR